MPPPGTFQKEDMYCRKQWQRVQHLSNQLWTRWRKEEFATLQTRKKWNQTKWNVEVGDIALVRGDVTTRKNGQWQEYWKRTVMRKLVAGRTNFTNKETSIFDRLVNKLVFFSWKWTLKSYIQEYWSISWWEDCNCQSLINAPGYMRGILLFLLTKK